MDTIGGVAYRFALDHPDRLNRFAILEVIPTVAFWDAGSTDLAQAAYHWNFLAQPAPFPECLIVADPRFWVDWTLSDWTLPRTLAPFAPDTLAGDRAQAADPARVAAMCADYRAGLHTDPAIDAAAPPQFIGGAHGFPASTGDPASVWRDWAMAVTDISAPTGHFAMEEAPEQVAEALRSVSTTQAEISW